jgi:transcriptional/translational regulatory protein YebC/TACO1
MAAAGSVAWQFTRKSYFDIPAKGNNFDTIFELAVEAGADDVEMEDDTISIIAPVEAFKEIGDSLKNAHIKTEEAGLKLVPNNEVELNVEDTLQVLKLVEAIEDLDDVQDVYSNLNISEEALAQLEAA